MMMKHIALAGVLSVGFATVSQASTVSVEFSGTVDAPSGETSAIEFIGENTNKLEWGPPSEFATSVESGNSSSLTVNDDTFTYNNVLSSGDILLGTITWNNQSNFSGGGVWSSAVNLSLGFVSPSVLELNQSVGFSITNTTDVFFDTDQNEIEGNNADEITGFALDATGFNLPIHLGGDLKLTSVFFGLEDAGSGSAYNAATGFWTNNEGGTSTIGIYGTVAAVPLPAGAWLLLTGFGGLAAMRRRSKKAA